MKRRERGKGRSQMKNEEIKGANKTVREMFTY